MAAGPWVGAATAAGASAYMAKAQGDAERRARLQRALIGPLPAAEPTPAKCACCGSHEFRKHAGRIICAYCRTDGRK